MLDEVEVTRIRNKYVLLGRFRRSLSYLMSCQAFLDARIQLHGEGYLDWHIFDAAIQCIGRYRLNADDLYTMSITSQRDFEVSGEQLRRYLFSYFEAEDGPTPPCERWSAEELRQPIETIGMAWLFRRGLLSRQRSFERGAVRQLLEENDFFSTDPRPDEFPVRP